MNRRYELSGYKAEQNVTRKVMSTYAATEVEVRLKHCAKREGNGLRGMSDDPVSDGNYSLPLAARTLWVLSSFRLSRQNQSKCLAAQSKCHLSM